MVRSVSAHSISRQHREVGAAMTDKRSLSYQELTAAFGSPELRQLAEAGMLTGDTMARIAHLARFFEALGVAAPNRGLKVGDVLTEAEVTKIWLDTADPNFDPGPRPILQ
jgi:hypothetical protein